ncbi:hypothetical protein ACVWZA_003821 [Sphingomonas sp. UYAg733]
MISKNPLAYVAIFALCVAVLLKVWVFSESSWPIYVWLPFLLPALWALSTFRERADPGAKAFDFNPKRGLLCFFAGLIVLPILAVINAVFGAELPLSSMFIYTGAGAVILGIGGTFTEHIDI